MEYSTLRRSQGRVVLPGGSQVLRFRCESAVQQVGYLSLRSNDTTQP